MSSLIKDSKLASFDSFCVEGTRGYSRVLDSGLALIVDFTVYPTVDLTVDLTVDVAVETVVLDISFVDGITAPKASIM